MTMHDAHLKKLQQKKPFPSLPIEKGPAKLITKLITKLFQSHHDLPDE